MKKIKLNNKLGLNKQIVSKLNENEMYDLIGGKKVRKSVACSDVCTVSLLCADFSELELCNHVKTRFVGCMTDLGGV